jgi:hypothetical protein
MAKLNSAEETVIKEINLWKAEEPGFLSKATHFISRPLVWAGDNLVPDEVKNKMSDLTEQVMAKLQDVSQWSVKPEEVLKATREFEINSETIVELRQASLFDLDHVAQGFNKTNSQMAAASGFGTGLIGWAGLVADLPALLALSFRNIYQISLCYGYDLTSGEEKQQEFEVGYMLRILRIAATSSQEDKLAALNDLKDYEMSHFENVTADLGHSFARKQFTKVAAIQVSNMIINEIVSHTLARKAVTSLPGIGAVLTAGFNYMYVKDVGQTAFMLYRERFLLDKKGRQKIVSIAID